MFIFEFCFLIKDKEATKRDFHSGAENVLLIRPEGDLIAEVCHRGLREPHDKSLCFLAAGIHLLSTT